MKRKSTGKRLRFKVFERDDFTYMCGVLHHKKRDKEIIKISDEWNV